MSWIAIQWLSTGQMGTGRNNVFIQECFCQEYPVIMREKSAENFLYDLWSIILMRREIISKERTKGDSGERRPDFLCLSITWLFLMKIIIPMMFLREIWADTHFERILYRNFGFRILECNKRRYRVRGDQIWCKKSISREILHRYSGADFSLAPAYRDARPSKLCHRRGHLVFPGKKNVAIW